METIASIDLITVNPQRRGGRPCIVGTSVRVTDIVMAHIFHHRSPGEIASDYELSLAQVHAALSYYYQHKEALDEDIRKQVATARALKEQAVDRGGDSLLP